MKALFTLILPLLLVWSSCSRYPREVERSLRMAGENRHELEQVLEHYRDHPEKYRAACFLIENMRDTYWSEGSVITAYDTLFSLLASLYDQKLPVSYMKDFIQQQWDSIARIHGKPSPSRAKRCPELSVIRGSSLIGHIDQAFFMRDSVPWGHDVSFEDFCAYVLPHRVGNELPEDWRTHLYHKTFPLRDTTRAQDRRTLADQLNRWVRRYMGHNGTFWSYTIDLPPSKLEKSRLGSCRHTVFYIAMMLRAHGIPVGIDYVRVWAGARNGHEWNVLLCEDGSFHPFDAVAQNFEMPLADRKIAKVFRLSFSSVEAHIPRVSWWERLLGRDPHLEIPAEFFNPHVRDVTHEYVRTADVKIPVGKNTGGYYALLCTFNNREWVPQYWGLICNGRAVFRNMGCGAAYRVMALREGKMQGLSDPFILDSLGVVRQLTPSPERGPVRMDRKYPLTRFMKGLMGFVVGHPFHGANRPDFSDSVRLFTILNTPMHITSVRLQETRRFRYARFYGAHMAEVSFYGLKPGSVVPGKLDTVRLEGRVIGSPEQDSRIHTPYTAMFDGDPATHFVAPRVVGSWGGMDFGRPEQIVKIVFCPRSDTNFIIPGEEYELCYWERDGWVSLGHKVAADAYLEYDSVPSGALYLLHNHTRGSEERIFTLEDGKQVFW